VHSSFVNRVSIDVNDEWLVAAREVLGTDTDTATINAALRSVLRKRAEEIVAALNSAECDFSGSERAWRYGGGRDLSQLAEKARNDQVT
jgi:Arc/MetJ family transcription regulator